MSSVARLHPSVDSDRDVLLLPIALVREVDRERSRGREFERSRDA